MENKKKRELSFGIMKKKYYLCSIIKSTLRKIHNDIIAYGTIKSISYRRLLGTRILLRQSGRDCVAYPT